MIQTSAGSVLGKDDAQDTQAWLGIPYAEPPIGELRWKKPIDPLPWVGVREARTFANRCPQHESSLVSSDPADGEQPTTYVGDEDCLYLNVWRPKQASAKLRPVMFWIHGGGNSIGSASDDTFEGAKLAAAADVVLVSLDYRLGPLGYLYLEALEDGDALDDSGTFGTLDILQALKWVQANAAAFGGDPSSVTIFGESAGGVNVWSMISSNLSQGLFHRAIVESGAAEYTTIDRAKQVSQRLIDELVVADGLADDVSSAEAFVAAQGDAWTRQYLEDKTPEELLSIYGNAGGGMLDDAFGPILDGTVLPVDAVTQLANGTYRKVPMLLGANRDESKLFLSYLYQMSDAQFDALMAQYGRYEDDILALYPRTDYSPATAYNQYTDIQDYGLELLGTLLEAYVVGEYQSDVWLYYFAYDNEVAPYDYVYGAAHGLELPFVFGNMNEDFYAAGSADERALLSGQMQAAWSCFAHTGQPSGTDCPDAVPFPPFAITGLKAFQRVVFDARTTTARVPGSDFDKTNLWLEILTSGARQSAASAGREGSRAAVSRLEALWPLARAWRARNGD